MGGLAQDIRALFGGGAIASIAAVILLGSVMAFDGSASLTSPAPGSSALYNSMVLDSAGNPAIALFDAIKGDLTIVRCNDSNCSGGDENITTPDTAGDVGRLLSLRLDAAGNPVVVYFDNSKADWKLMHCNDTHCSGNDESIVYLGIGRNGPTSFVIDAAGRPVFSFGDGTLRILRCDDVNCTTSTIASPDVDSGVGDHSSLALDSLGYPVVSYQGDNSLRVLHCGNAACSSGNSISEPETNATHTNAMVLDGSGFPVTVYVDSDDGAFELMRCNDVNCSGGDEVVTQIDSAPGTDRFVGPSLALDALDRPVLTYWKRSLGLGNGNLVVLHCVTQNCILSSGIGVATGLVLHNGMFLNFPSLALDALENPVLAYGVIRSGENYFFELQILHCGDASCEKSTEATDTPTPTTVPCPGGKVDEGAGCGTPTVSPPHTSGGAEMLMTIADGNCETSIRPVTCDVAVGAEFTAVVDVKTAPPDGYYLMQTFVDFGETLAYTPVGNAADGIVWPECEVGLSSSVFGPGFILHTCLTAFVPPLPLSSYVGPVVELAFTCSETPSSSLVRLLPNDNPDPITNGALFIGLDNLRTIPKLNALVVNCVVPSAVGGVVLDSALSPLAAIDTESYSTKVRIASLALAFTSIAAALGAVGWFVRRGWPG